MTTRVLRGGRLIDGAGRGPIAETAIAMRGGEIVRNRLEPSFLLERSR